jgi:hypothetical protein
VKPTTFTTRQLLESPRVFGLRTATDVQKAWWDASDGLDVSAFANNPDVIKAFGGTLPAAGAPPREVLAVLAIRVAKSMWAAAKPISASQTVDASQCSAGDIVKFHVVSLTLASTRAVMSHLLAAVQKPALRPLVIGEPSMTGITLRHPSGRPIEVTPTPLDRAGGSAASTWSAGAIFDEAPRMIGAADGVKNYDHAVDTLRGRMLPGAQILSIGSPWAPSGPIYARVEECFGKPSRDCLVIRATGPACNPIWWTPEKCASLVGTPSYQMDVLGEFADPTSGLIDPHAIRRSVSKTPVAVPANAIFRAAIDPSELHAGGNSFAFAVIAGWLEENDASEPKAKYALVHCEEWRTGALPLVFRDMRRVLDRYKLDTVFSDQWSKAALREIAVREGVDLRFMQKQVADRQTDWEDFATAIEQGQLSLPDDRQLVNDLLGCRRVVSPTAFRVELALTPDGRHADKAAAVQLAFSTFRSTKLNYTTRRTQRQYDLSALDSGRFFEPDSKQAEVTDRIDRQGHRAPNFGAIELPSPDPWKT